MVIVEAKEKVDIDIGPHGHAITLSIFTILKAVSFQKKSDAKPYEDRQDWRL